MKVKMITDVKKNKKSDNYLVLMKKLPKNVADNLVSQKLASKDNKSGNYQLTTTGKTKALRVISNKKKVQNKKIEARNEAIMKSFLESKAYSSIRDTAMTFGVCGAICLAIIVAGAIPSISVIPMILLLVIGGVIGFVAGDLVDCLICKKPLNFYAFSKKCPY